MRARLISLHVLLALAAPLAVGAQSAGKVYRIGYLSAGSPDAYSVAFQQSLRDLGWAEENVVVEQRWAGGKNERLPALASELVGLRPDVFVTITTPATHAAVAATTTVPIVFTMVADPVGSGFIASLARPGGNVTGLTFVPELDFFSKQLELLREIAPGVSRVAILWAAANPVHASIVEVTTAAAARLGLEALSRPVRTLAEIEQVFTALPGSGPSACLVIADFMFFVHGRRLAELASKARVPVMYGVKEQVDLGGLIAYAPDLLAMQRRAAMYVDKILRGAKPADLPAERPSKFVLVINRQAALALGLTIPPSLLLRADQVIE